MFDTYKPRDPLEIAAYEDGFEWATDHPAAELTIETAAGQYGSTFRTVTAGAVAAYWFAQGAHRAREAHERAS